MNRFKLALFAAVAIATVTTFTQPAAAIEYPWCAQYGSGGDDGGRNCGFTTIDQCMQTVRGIGGFCEPNLFYLGSEDKQPRPARKHQR